MATLTRLGETGASIIGHRGSPAHTTENTPEGFRLARDQGADGVELDVRRTADDVLVVHHDPVVEGLGDLVGVAFADLRRQAPHVPTLEEALDACAGMFVNAEVKNSPLEPDWDPDDQVGVALARRIARHGLYDRILVSSFNPGTLAAVRRTDTNIATGWLLPRRVPATPAVSAAAASGHRALHPHASSLRGKAAERVAARAADAGLWTITWTVDEADEVRRLSAAGITGIITDDPAMAVAALGRIPSP